MPGIALAPIREVGDFDDDDSLFNTQAEAHRRGSSCTGVFEYGVSEGLRMASAESDCEDDGSSVACSEILFRGGVVDQVAEPRLLCLDELLPIDCGIQVTSNPEPAKIIRDTVSK